MWLLRQLETRSGAVGVGEIHHFFEVDPNWRCPCCFRAKHEMARIDKNGKLLCAIHNHHDHFIDEVRARITMDLVGDEDKYIAITESFIRFKNIFICSDCNVAEPAAKKIVSAPKIFSFAPFEISGFIMVKNNHPHGIDGDSVVRAFESARLSMRQLMRRARLLAMDLGHETNR